jgi:hypothetical protein
MNKDEHRIQWSLKRAEGCILGYIKGTLEAKRAVGMLKRALNWGVKDSELKAILDSIEISPVYLPSMKPEDKARKINELRELLELN